ncbi:65-kDa microtubule-associated protein 1-like [Hibiscus syriacus]|uniref:65-kDa microtubule-associated protein 1-like n=1 Tax=Hibiscus syriacus TaxID=106335 RepID=A0A6A3C903_HIBSY|nr:splicing factor, suppressor of white-apricot homolog [Hibiscus syriacus]XP_039061103.1 splicing factor, suppressor of white-apricot homolog [Hibiscus syriacus]KAE8723539.1 65-kDa microtubule-associated protein 1-like [Hibiscus syriacus]
MDLEVVGRHALLFDDDAMASLVNSGALVDWNSLSIDRYDVRHLLSGPPPPRKRRRHLSSPSKTAGDTLESDLDRERYLDLPPPSPSLPDHQDGDNDDGPAASGGQYNAVSFSYGNAGESNEWKDADVESSFRPPFPVPKTLLQNLPPTEKVHLIISRTALFVSKHGAQSEIVLRVKQGDNPTFGFLMPDHPLHPYFRFLVDHQELLSSNSVDEEGKADGAHDRASSVRGGALSLLGTVYGSGEDEDGETENDTEVKRTESVRAGVAIDKASTDGTEQKESSISVNRKYDAVTRHSAPLKEKASVIKRNQSIKTVKAGTTTVMKKESDPSAAEKSRASSFPPTSKVELPVVEPPSDLKRVVDKIVEFILRNGRQFEAVLVEQDVKHGRFPFLLPSNLYHPYYLEALQNAKKSKLPGKAFGSEKHDSSGCGLEREAASSRESDSASVGSDIPYNSDRKEKFKMVINKSRKDGQDPPSKASHPQIGVSVDAAAAAAILQAATRGFKRPNLEVLSKVSLNGSSQVPTSEEGQAPNFGSSCSSQPKSSEKAGQKGEVSVSGPVANAIAKTAAIVAASEADSSEACLTKEEKLKAERLKRAKMFAALIKSGSAPLKTEALRGLSAEPPDLGVCGSGVESGLGKVMEGSPVASDVNTCDKNEKHEKMNSGIDNNERRSKRKYRTRSERHEADSGQEEGVKQEEEKEEEVRDRHSGKKRRSHHHSRDRRKHRQRHSSSKHRDSRHLHKHDSSTDDERSHKSDNSDSDHHHSRHKRKRDTPLDIEHRRHSGSIEGENRHKHDNSSGDEYRRSRHRHKHRRSSDDEYYHRRKRSGREAELEEGEIIAKSDKSKLSEGNAASREASADISNPAAAEGRASSMPSATTTISNDLRAKIRAMLMATL